MKTNPNSATKKLIKEAIQNDVAPLLIGLRNELKNVVTEVRGLNVENRPMSGVDIFNMLKGDKGDAPVLGVDYWTDQDREEVLKTAKPKYGIDYFTPTEVIEFKKAVTPIKDVDYFDGFTPTKGIDYFTPEEIKNFLSKVTPIKGIHYRDGNDGVTKTITEVRYQNIEPEDIRNKLQSLKGRNKLRIDDIYQLPDILDALKLQKGGGSGIGGSGGTGTAGATAFTSLTDVPSSYSGAALKVVRVNAGANALEFVALAGGGDALKADPLSQFAATTSLQLKGVISDETGSGALVFADTPTLVTPVIGAATGTSLQLSGLTASQILATDASKNLVSLAVATYPSLTELTYVKGVTSAIQTQLNARVLTTSFVDNEVVSGSGTSFTLANTPIAGSVHVHALGQRLILTTDYSISGTTITTVSSWGSGEITADYRK